MGRKRAWYETASQRGMIPELGLTGCDLHRVLLSDQLSWLQASRYRHEESDRKLGYPCVRGRLVARKDHLQQDGVTDIVTLARQDGTQTAFPRHLSSCRSFLPASRYRVFVDWVALFQPHWSATVTSMTEARGWKVGRKLPVVWHRRTGRVPEMQAILFLSAAINHGIMMPSVWPSEKGNWRVRQLALLFVSGRTRGWMKSPSPRRHPS